MITDPKEISEIIKSILKKHVPPLKIRKDSATAFEVWGTKEITMGKKKVDGIYFATIVPKPKDARFYFFPIYTNPKNFENISEKLRKCLKGKSCFYIKNLDAELEKDIKLMIKTGVTIYKKGKMI